MSGGGGKFKQSRKCLTENIKPGKSLIKVAGFATEEEICIHEGFWAIVNVIMST